MDPVEAMESAIGILIGSGLSLESILDMTFEQIQITARCVTDVKVKWVNALAEPIMGALGADYKPASTDGPARSASKNRKNMSDDEKKTAENNKLLGLASMGIPVL